MPHSVMRNLIRELAPCHLTTHRTPHVCYSYVLVAVTAACCKLVIEFYTFFTLPQGGHQAYTAVALLHCIRLSLARLLPDGPA